MLNPLKFKSKKALQRAMLEEGLSRGWKNPRDVVIDPEDELPFEGEIDTPDNSISQGESFVKSFLSHGREKND